MAAVTAAVVSTGVCVCVWPVASCLCSDLFTSQNASGIQLLCQRTDRIKAVGEPDPVTRPGPKNTSKSSEEWLEKLECPGMTESKHRS